MLSVVIPVYNNWSLTAACLASLATTTHGMVLEVLVVDNASSDATVDECTTLGARLFPGHFTYLRNEENKNFAGAVNEGVRHAHGDLLFLLNNDTILQKDWLPPLLKTLQTDDSLGAVGPLLLYPVTENCHLVQHAGVSISLGRQVSHLYEYLPYPHALLRKQRFFQVITAAAFLIPRQRYHAMGGFDEGFINGFEDVEFCHRLCRAGYRQTVVPESVVLHYGGQSTGRNAHEAANSARCAQLCPALAFDEASLYRADGYEPMLSTWLKLEPHVPPSREKALLAAASKGTLHDLEAAVRHEPYWIQGTLLLARRQELQGNLRDAFATLAQACRLRATPETLVPFAQFLRRHGQKQALDAVQAAMAAGKEDATSRRDSLHAFRSELLACHDDALLAQVNHILATT